MNKTFIGIAIASTLIVGCAGTSAPSTMAVTETVKSNESYAADAAGNVIKSGTGDCVVNGSYNKDSMLMACDPAAAAKAAADKAAADAAAKAAADQAAADKAAAAAAAKAAADQAAADAAAAASAEPVAMNLSGRAPFASGSSTLSGEGQQSLQKLVEQLSSYKVISSLTVTGHTDSQGAEALNKALSLKRAEAVSSYIVQSGVAGNADITVMGVGESAPVASNTTAEGRQQNRRVVVEVRGLQ